MNQYLLTFELETQDAADRILSTIRYKMEREEGLYCGSRWTVTTDSFAVTRHLQAMHLCVTVAAERIEHAAEDATGHVEWLTDYEYEPKLVRIEAV